MFAKPSTARWLVKIMPPYLGPVGLVLSEALNAPVVKRERTWDRFLELKRCSRTGTKVGV